MNANGKTMISLRWNSQCRFLQVIGGKNSRAIERGPLVYALKIGEKWEKKVDKEKGEYFDISPTTPWNYGIVSNVITDPLKNSTVIDKSVTRKFYWNQANAPIEIQVNARKIHDWDIGKRCSIPTCNFTLWIL